MDDEVIAGSASSPGESSGAAAAFRLSTLGAKKVKIAALHKVQTVADETNDLAAQAIVAPRRASRNPVAEQDLGDSTVIGAVQRTVEGAQGEPKTAASIGREGRWYASALYQQAMEAPRRVDSVLEQSVERKHEGERPRPGFSQQERAPRWRQCEQV